MQFDEPPRRDAPIAITRPQIELTPVTRLDPNLTRFYTNFEQNQRTRGLLRTDGGTLDAAYDRRILARNFKEIALFEEFTRTSRGMVQARSASSLKRWRIPVGVNLRFDGSTPPDQRAQLNASLQNLTSSIRQATGHPIGVSANPNIHILVLSEGQRQSSSGILLGLAPTLQRSELDLIRNLSRSDQCVVLAFQDPRAPFTYNKAIIVIRAELTPLLQRACLHEELAQAMGLANDSPSARPSVFNDDDEFAFLTQHDYDLLRLLYNPQLQPGMPAQVAGPIVDQILGNGQITAAAFPAN